MDVVLFDSSGEKQLLDAMFLIDCPETVQARCRLRQSLHKNTTFAEIAGLITSTGPVEAAGQPKGLLRFSAPRKTMQGFALQ